MCTCPVSLYACMHCLDGREGWMCKRVVDRYPVGDKIPRPLLVLGCLLPHYPFISWVHADDYSPINAQWLALMYWSAQVGLQVKRVIQGAASSDADTDHPMLVAACAVRCFPYTVSHPSNALDHSVILVRCHLVAISYFTGWLPPYIHHPPQTPAYITFMAPLKIQSFLHHPSDTIAAVTLEIKLNRRLCNRNCVSTGSLLLT